MLYVLIEINNIDIIKRLDQDFFENLNSKINTLLDIDDKCFVRSVGNLFFFKFDLNYIEIIQIQNVLQELNQFFIDNKKKLQGVIIFSYFTEITGMEEILGHMKKKILQITESYAIVYDESVQFLTSHSSQINHIEKSADLQSINSKGLEILYSLYSLKKILSRSLVVSYISRFDYDLDEINIYFLLSDKISSEAELDEKISHFKQGIELDDLNVIEEKLIDYIFESYINGGLKDIENCLDYLKTRSKTEKSLKLLFLLIRDEYSLFFFDKAREYRNEVFQPFYKEIQQTSFGEVAERLFQLQEKILLLDERGSHKAFSELKKLNCCEKDFLYPYFQLMNSEYYLAILDFDKSLSFSKEILSFCNDKKNLSFLVAETNLLIAGAMMGKKRQSESESYFKFAVSQTRSDITAARASMNLSVLKYIEGDFAASLILIDEALYSIREKAARFKANILFFKARIYFELGRYVESEKLFEEVITLIIGNDFGLLSVAKAWQARSMIYGRKIMKGICQLDGLVKTPEVYLFESEARYFIEDYAAGYDLINKASDLMENSCAISFLPSHFVNFETGYRMYEDKIIKDNSGFYSLYSYIKAFQTLSAAKNKIQVNIDEFVKFLREEKFIVKDPLNRIFCLFISMALDELNADMDLNYLTTLNRALKYLQEYSGATKEPGIRLNYLSANIWNKIILQEAEKHKLL